MVIAGNTGLAAERARHNLRLKKKKAAPAGSYKLQAPSATKKTQFKSMVKLERNKS